MTRPTDTVEQTSDTVSSSRRQDRGTADADHPPRVDGGRQVTLKIDLQTHTDRSRSCGWMSPETLVRRAEDVGLDGVAVTDHNTMTGVEPARRAASDDFLVIPAEEIDTTEGQIIGLFLEEEIEPWQSPSAVASEVHDQGGLTLAPHPFDEMRAGLTTASEYVDILDGVETCNSRCVRAAYNRRAEAFADEHQLPSTGGSDAHFACELGRAWTRVQVAPQEGVADPTESQGTVAANGGEAATLDAVADAIQRGRVTPVGSTGTPLVHVGTKAVKLYNRVISGEWLG